MRGQRGEALMWAGALLLVNPLVRIRGLGRGESISPPKGSPILHILVTKQRPDQASAPSSPGIALPPNWTSIGQEKWTPGVRSWRPRRERRARERRATSALGATLGPDLLLKCLGCLACLQPGGQAQPQAEATRLLPGSTHDACSSSRPT